MNRWFCAGLAGFLFIPLEWGVADVFLGKSPAEDTASWAFVHGPRPDVTAVTNRGKRPELVWEGPAPASAGIGLRFDTKTLFYVYADQSASANHFAPSGWMGDWSDLRFTDRWSENPADGATCIRIDYDGNGLQGYGWAGIYWQEPRNNWGDHKGGYSLRGMRKLTFWARGARGGERIAVFKAGGIGGAYPDTGEGAIGPIDLTASWRRYEIPLEETDLSRIAGGFAWATSADLNGKPITFFLDEIRYQRD